MRYLIDHELYLRDELTQFKKLLELSEEKVDDLEYELSNVKKRLELAEEELDNLEDEASHLEYDLAQSEKALAESAEDLLSLGIRGDL